MQTISRAALLFMPLQNMVAFIALSFCLRQLYHLGKPEVMAVLVEVPGVNINATDRGGNTPLHIAVSRGISKDNFHVEYFGNRMNFCLMSDYKQCECKKL